MPDIIETPFTEALLDSLENPKSVSDIYTQIDNAWDEFLGMVSDLSLTVVCNADDDLPF